jgi:transcriptional regulator with XRE-family HTH domain
MNFADMLRAWRHHQELSIREAAERIGIDRGALYRLEKGESVNQATILQVIRWSFEKDSLSKEEAA